MTLLRSALRIAAAISLALFLFLTISFFSFRSSWTNDSQQSADVIIVMGAAQYDGVPSKLLEVRLQQGLEVWKSGRAPLIALTGGKRDGDRFTEAATGKRWLTDRGVPSSAIVSEEVGRSSWESLSELAPVLQSNQVGKAILVSSYWHVQRSELILMELGFVTDSSPVPVSAESARWNSRVVREFLGVTAGRLIGFRNLFAITD